MTATEIQLQQQQAGKLKESDAVFYDVNQTQRRKKVAVFSFPKAKKELFAEGKHRTPNLFRVQTKQSNPSARKIHAITQLGGVITVLSKVLWSWKARRVSRRLGHARSWLA